VGLVTYRPLTDIELIAARLSWSFLEGRGDLEDVLRRRL
jgi:hypothetical protein